MAIQIAATKTSLATTYIGLGAWFGLSTASPGTAATPASEASGSGYARVQTTWGSASSGVSSGSAVTITAGAATYTFCLLASASTVASANMIDNAAITSTVLSATGQIVLTPTITIS